MKERDEMSRFGVLHFNLFVATVRFDSHESDSEASIMSRVGDLWRVPPGRRRFELSQPSGT